MKNLKLIFLLTSSLIVGCESDHTNDAIAKTQTMRMPHYSRTFEYDGHRYIQFDDYQFQSIVHDPKCPYDKK